MWLHVVAGIILPIYLSPDTFCTGSHRLVIERGMDGLLVTKADPCAVPEAVGIVIAVTQILNRSLTCQFRFLASYSIINSRRKSSVGNSSQLRQYDWVTLYEKYHLGYSIRKLFTGRPSFR